MRVGTSARYEGLKRDQNHAMRFGFVENDEEEQKSEKQFEITSQHLEDNASICSSIPQSDHVLPSRSSKRKMLMGDDGVAYESIVVDNTEEDAESRRK